MITDCPNEGTQTVEFLRFHCEIFLQNLFLYSERYTTCLKGNKWLKIFFFSFPMSFATAHRTFVRWQGLMSVFHFNRECKYGDNKFEKEKKCLSLCVILVFMRSSSNLAYLTPF